jgi:hypothetical protein
MANDPIDPMFLEVQEGGVQPELLVSAVLHLMSHYTARSPEDGACVKLASVIERHLKALAGLPELAPVLRATCQQLSEQWEEVVERTLPKPVKTNFLGRWMTAAKPG